MVTIQGAAAMGMTPGLRKFTLTAHVSASVGWLGAVAAFLALAIAGLTHEEPETIRGAYVAMDLVGWFVIVPFCLASLLTGLVQSLGTEWGLFRHYWIQVKLLLTVAGTILLLLHMQPTSRMASAVAETTELSADLSRLRVQLVADAGAALFVLLLTTALSVYKPWGTTPYGRRRLRPALSSGQFSLAAGPGPVVRSPWGRYVLIAVVGFVLIVIAVHLAGRGLGGH